MNILLTTVGRRSYLVDYFKDALGHTGKVFAANSEELTSGMTSADQSFVTSRVNSPSYISDILTICRKNNVRAVISLFDIDLPYLAAARERFQQLGVELVVSDAWVIDIVNDKWKTYQFLKAQGLNSPETYLSLSDAKLALKEKKIKFPLIIKPRWGMGSISLFRADNTEELEFFFRYSVKLIKKSYLSILSEHALDAAVVIQQWIEGEEYGLDVFNDLKGNHIITIPKKKLAMRAGETDIAMAVNDSALMSLGEQISAFFHHRGNMDVDVFRDKKNNDYILEMNARFGGGYPFSHVFGANMVKSLVGELIGNLPKVNRPITGKVAMKKIDISPVEE